MEIRFLSKNEDKFGEVQTLLEPHGYRLIRVDYPIEERQTASIERLVREKTKEAFDYVGRPVMVEHTGLFLASLGELPGGITDMFWQALKEDGLSRMFGDDNPGTCIARTYIGFCNGRRITIHKGEISGRIATEPRGDRRFQWDCVFVPDGYDKTFAEMGALKNDISMRRRAVDHFLKDQKAK